MDESGVKIDIPQIKPENSTTESILVPKAAELASQSLEKPKTKFSLIAGLLILIVFFLAAIVLPGYVIYGKARRLQAAGVKLVETSKGQNIDAVRTELTNTRSSLADLNKSFKLIAWAKIVPFLGAYIKDASHAVSAGVYGLEAAEITLLTVEPYADILGFSGGSVQGVTSDGAKTTQERINFLVKALPDLVPKAEEISQKVDLARRELTYINPNRYPAKFRGKEVREKIKKGLDLANQAADLVTAAQPLLEVSPYLLGLDGQTEYLVLFQNDKELRPTGGFMTAYAVMKVDKAKFEPVSSNDIYNLDARYKPNIEVPDPIAKYIKGPYILSQNWRLRDMNWSADFREAMELVTAEMESVGISGIDGVIAVDTQVLVYLLDALGPIGVPGFGNFSTQIEPKCSCPQVIYELESFADTEGPIVWDPITGKIVYTPPNYDNRKKIIGPLMNSILANAMGQPKEKLPGLFTAAFKSFLEKHVLIYLFDEKAQRAVEDFGIAGRIKGYPADYLYINDANLGGRKSNLYVNQDVEQVINVAKDGSIEKTVTITYKNPEKQDGWLNSVLPNWVRIYVPQGSELIAFEGVEDQAQPYEEFGKSVFAGFFKLRPEGLAKVTVKYRLPFKADEDLKLFIQKQPGKDAPLYRTKMGKREEEFFLKKDTELRLGI